ncbi:hypothetical protein [Alteromonas facilis]|uniref:hypothetical protein n=1 Tax=Alteromonas facilis TaxID=2048004 RepID=UPI000C28CFDD|nr:hypothetical protein [Alteromonas facilis]
MSTLKRKTLLHFPLIITLTASAALLGCESTGTRYSEKYASTGASNDDGVVCKMEKRIGSNMMTRVCRTAEERRAMEDAAREGILRLQSGSETGGDG